MLGAGRAREPAEGVRVTSRATKADGLDRAVVASANQVRFRHQARRRVMFMEDEDGPCKDRFMLRPVGHLSSDRIEVGSEFRVGHEVSY